MKQAAIKFALFLRCYQILIVWGICAFLVLIAFFHIHLPGEQWIFILWIGVLIEFFSLSKIRKSVLIPKKYCKYVIAILFVSVLFSFLVTFFITVQAWANGYPTIVDGEYVLEQRGYIKEILSEQEYHRLKCLEQVQEAGHGMAFYAIIMMFRCEWKKKN